MKILLDTNIVLNGAFNRYTVARDLVNTTDVLNYYISYSSIREVDNLLKINCVTKEQKTKATFLVKNYLQSLGCLILSPGDPKLSLEILDTDDRPIVSTAKENTIETICSYNIQDIVSFNGKVKTPLELTREYGQNLINNIFRIKGKRIGTIFSVIEPRHKSSIGDLFGTDDGVEYFFNEEGFFSSTDSNHLFSVENKIEAGKRIGLVIRSKKDFFEVSCWSPEKGGEWYHGNKFIKTTLASGNVEFKKIIDLTLATNRGDRHYSGHIMNISVVPNFIKEAHIQKAMGAMCLDVVYGSENLMRLLKEMEFMA